VVRRAVLHQLDLLCTSATKTLEGIYLGGLSVYGNGSDGINVNVGADAFIRHVFLDGTVVDSNDGYGVILQGGGEIERAHLDNVWVSFNGDASGDHGLVLTAACTDAAVKNSHVLLNYHDGILVYGATRTTLANNAVYNNDRGAQGACGIDVANNAARTIIAGNQVYNDSSRSEVQDGVVVASGSTDTEVTGNFLDTGGATTRFSDAGTRTRHLHNTEDTTVGPISRSDVIMKASLDHDGTTVGFYGVTPTTRPTAIADADGTLADLTTKFNSLIGKLETLGLLAT
jgi:parallel beta-helix repeat protein